MQFLYFTALQGGKGDNLNVDEGGDLAQFFSCERAALLKDHQALATALTGKKFIKDAIKWATAKNKAEQKKTSSSFLSSSAQHDEVAKILEGLDRGVFQSIAFGPEDIKWGAAVFSFMVTCCTQGFEFSGINAYGVAEAVVVLSGSQVYAGCPYDKVPGDSYSDKYSWLAKSSGETVSALLKSQGWVMLLRSGDIGFIPTDHFIMTYVFEAGGATMLRWGIDGNRARILKLVMALLGAYSSLRATAYGEWLSFLQKHVV